MDKHFIFSAAAYAQRAADHLHGLQPRQTEEKRVRTYPIEGHDDVGVGIRGHFDQNFLKLCKPDRHIERAITNTELPDVSVPDHQVRFGDDAPVLKEQTLRDAIRGARMPSTLTRSNSSSVAALKSKLCRRLGQIS